MQQEQIPLEDFFKNPEKTGFKLSPGGKRISWLANYEQRLNIYIRDSENNIEKRLTARTDRDIRSYFWLTDDQLAFFQDTGGDENEHIFVVDVHTGDTKDITPFEGVKVDLIDELEDVDDAIIIGMNKRNPEIFDVYRLNTITEAITLIEENPGNITAWITDHTGALRLATTTDGVNTSLLERTAPGQFRTIITTGFRETLAPLFFDFEQKHVYALSNIGRDKIAIVLIDITDAHEIQCLFEHPDVDAGQLGFSKKRKVITSATYTTWKTEFVFFDSESEQRYAKVKSLINEDAEIYITDRDKAEEVFIVRTLSDRTLGNYYLYHATNNTITHLANVSPWLQANKLCSMEPISYESRDGLTIHGYLTLPDSGHAPYPVVIHPHGGPWARDVWQFNPEVQFLANRGYGVLQMNFRGSTGYGRAFLEASFKEWGKKMQDDITDGVQYLIEKGIADKDRIAIYGASYGGYATLAGLTFTPDLYTCGVDYVGVSSLFSFMETIPPYWAPYLEMMYEMVGHPEKDRELLAEASPLLHIDNIKAPLFVAQGARDPRVKKSESDQIVQALTEKGVDVLYMVRENEGHGFMNMENKFAFYAEMESFLSRHMQSKKK